MQSWLDSLPSELEAHQVFLQELLTRVEMDKRWEWLELGCSLAEGRADAFSDLDLGLGVTDSGWPQSLDDLEEMLRSLDSVIGLLRHKIPGWADKDHERFFVQYASGLQIDLVAVPATKPKGKQPESLMLYDPKELRTTQGWNSLWSRGREEQVTEWTFLAWVGLMDASKYMMRGSLWEAYDRIHEVRSHIWRLWASPIGSRTRNMDSRHFLTTRRLTCLLPSNLQCHGLMPPISSRKLSPLPKSYRRCQAWRLARWAWIYRKHCRPTWACSSTG